MSFTLETSRTGKDAIVYNRHKYRETYTVKSGDIVWKCLGRNCKASITTNSERTGIVSSKDCHTGPHPVTLRMLTPTSEPGINNSTSCNSPINNSQTLHEASGTPVSPRSAHLTTTSPTLLLRGCEESDRSVIGIQAENDVLKEELSRLRSEMRVILDHSIESDQRLLQYTEEVFPHPQHKPSTVPVTSESPIHSQTQSELDKAYLKIQQLQYQLELLSQPCNACAIFKEEAGNMIASIQCLEAENKSLKDIIQIRPKKISTQADQTTMSQLSLHNKLKVLNVNGNCNNEDDGGFTTVTSRRGRTQQKQPVRQHKLQRPKKKDQQHQSKLEEVTHIPFNDVTVIGDSHVRNLAKLLGNKVAGDTSICGVCRPGAGLLSMKTSIEAPRKHCYVLMAGTNDVDAGREDIVFEHLEEILSMYLKSSSVLVVPLTKRYDLPPNSHIHQTVNRVNAYMTELCGRYENVELVDIGGIGRQHHTSHGLHLRNSGKRLLTGLIAERLAGLPVTCSPHGTQTAGTSNSQSRPSLEYGRGSATVSKPTIIAVPRENQSSQVSDISSVVSFLKGKQTLIPDT